ncbi:MAG: protein kinase [Vicinamibacterales bacterium]
MIGTTIDHYRITSELGAGGMGVVLRADDLKLGRPVALKFLSEALAKDRTIHDRFLREARAAAALNHPGICTIYEINDAGPRPFLAMELLEGQTLQQLASRAPLPFEQVLDVGIQVADALQAAHEKGLVHRDIKPGNIFLTMGGRAKVVDFGLAKAVEPSEDSSQSAVETRIAEGDKTRSGTTLGTVAYMSPEQARGERLDCRSDIFSLGLVLYEISTAQRPFDGATAAIVFDGILNRMPPAPTSLRPELPEAFERILARAIEKDPDRRYQRVSDLASDLRRLQRASDPAVAAATGLAAGSGPVASASWGTGQPGSAGQPESSEALPAGGTTHPAPPKPRRRAVPLAALAAVTIVAGGLLGAAVLGWPFGSGDGLSEGDAVIVTDFDNKTGDPDFDGTLREALAIKLEESPYVNVVSTQQTQEMLRLMARQPESPLTREVGREMCQRMGVPAIMTGEIARLGSSYVLTLAAESCATGEPIAREQVEAGRKEEVLAALGSATSAMRGRLGESLSSIARLDQPLFQATTPSLEALKSFAVGDRKRAAGLEIDSIPFYRRAIELDAQFAMAYGRLGTVYGNMGEVEQSREFYRKAFEMRERASERERLYITAHYNASVLLDPGRARQVYDIWRQTYPHDYIPAHNLGVIAFEQGDYEAALEAFREASKLDSRSRLPRDMIAEVQAALGRFDIAREEIERQVRELGPSPKTHLSLYMLDYLAGDIAGMAEHAQALKGTNYNAERQAVDHKIALFEGRFRDARALSATIAEQAEQNGFPERGVGARANQVVSEALAGNTSRTREEVRRLATQAAHGEGIALAFALVLSGDAAGARPVFDAAAEEMDHLPETAAVLRPAFEASILLARGDPAGALRALEPARSWEGRTADAVIASFIRGQAHLALKQGEQAAEAFTVVVQHRGLHPLGVPYVAAHLGLARSRAMAGDVEGARKAYDEFFRLWRNADADIPLLLQARSEYAKLESRSM